MKVTCFGSRGSIPAPSSDGFKFYTNKYGGDTTCYMVEAGPFNIIIDAGSGARQLGNYMMANGKFGHNIMLFTHYHWDHIQGMPFCIPFYIGTNQFHIHGFTPDNSNDTSYIANVVMDCLSRQQEKPFFPVPHSSMPAKKHYVSHDQMFSETFYYSYDEGDKSYNYIPEIVMTDEVYKNEQENLLKITTIPLNHPNGALGYRISYMGKSVGLCWDTESFAYSNANIGKICNGIDLIIMDGQYTEEQLSGMTQGFGHGQPEQCVHEADFANVKRLVITHHDPSHDDNKLEDMELACKTYASEGGFSRDSVEFAKQGNTWEV